MANHTAQELYLPSRININGRWLPALSSEKCDGGYIHMVFYTFCDPEWLRSLAPNGNSGEFNDPTGYIISHTTDQSVLNLNPPIDGAVSQALALMFADAQMTAGSKVAASELYLAVTPAAFRAIIENYDNRVLMLDAEHVPNYEARDGQRIAGNNVQSFTRYLTINGHRLRHISYDLPRYAWVEHNGMGVASWSKAAQS